MFGKKKTSEIQPKEITPQANEPVHAPPPLAEASAETAPVADYPEETAEPEAPSPIDTFLMAIKTTDTPTISFTNKNLENQDYKQAKEILIETLLEKIDFETIERLPKVQKEARIRQSAESLIADISLPLNGQQHSLLQSQIVDEVLGFGPLEVLMADDSISDIMINTSQQVYIEKEGKIYLTDVTFSSERHLLNIIQKIVSRVGRRIDETSPMVDARMPDGSRFNAIIPPLALDGTLVSIRKFKASKMPLSDYVALNSMSEEMYRFLAICGRIRLNIMISGGTGSGKTTLLNALSGHIDTGERVITIEDAAELQLHQPHVLRLETRPANIEGMGEINQRQLVRNALRMRPDRIILGEIRGDEVIDVLAAMNTGHEGSMATIHANSPRDCLARIENLIGLAGVNMPVQALRRQIASALELIVQIARMRDGRRRIVKIEEVVGMEGDTIITQELYHFKPGRMDDSGLLTGQFLSSRIMPRFMEKAAYFGLDKELEEAILGTNNREQLR